MSEELIQRDLINNPEKIGEWHFYNIGATNLNSLKKYNIIKDIDYSELKLRKVDGIITHNKEVIAIIEFKPTSEINTEAKRNKWVKSWLPVTKKLKSKILLLTDNIDNTFWINGLNGEIISEDNQELKYKFDKNDINLPKKIRQILNNISTTNSKIAPLKYQDPTPLSKQIWQDIWVVSGASPENCLYTFVELFIFKYLSDLEVLGKFDNFYYLMDYIDEEGSKKGLEEYASKIRPRIKELFPCSSLDKTTIINGTIFVSKDDKAIEGYDSTFKKILDRFADYGKLENIDVDFKSKLFESFLKESISKKNWGQFFTPLKIINSISKIIHDEIKIGMHICDPACGVGKFLLQPIIEKINKFYSVTDKIENKITLTGFDKGFDKDEQKTIILAKANMLIYFSELLKENKTLTQEFSKLFNETFTLKTNSILGTLSEKPTPKYDLILTNPPYVVSGSSTLKEEIKKSALQESYTCNGIGVEGLFMEWIVRSLKHEGKAFIVIPDGILNRIADTNLRNFIQSECFIDAIISLPAKAFFTTNKKTYILVLTKKINTNEKQLYPVFTYLCSSIGETLDINRFDIPDNDLENAVSLYNQFKGYKTGFKTNDKRCKILSIDNFTVNLNDWIVDKHWSDSDLIEFGIKEKEQILSIEEFKGAIDTSSNLLSEIKNEIESLEETSKDEYITKSISDIFKIEKGKSIYTKEYIHNMKGDYPVYSSQTSDDGIIGYINTYDYDCDALTWTTDGTYVGTVFYRCGKFSMTTHCGALFLKEEFKDLIYLPYMKYLLNNILSSYKVGEGSNKRLGVTKIANIKIELPINNNIIDIEKQQYLYNNYKIIDEVKHKISTDLNSLLNCKINI